MNVTSTLRPMLLLAALALVAAACGSDESPCEKAVDEICAAACTCGGSTGCAIGDATSAITFENKSSCVALFSLSCSESSGSTTDFAACQAALASPMCVQSTDGQVLELPAACD